MPQDKNGTELLAGDIVSRRYRVQFTSDNRDGENLILKPLDGSDTKEVAARSDSVSIIRYKESDYEV